MNKLFKNICKKCAQKTNILRGYLEGYIIVEMIINMGRITTMIYKDVFLAIFLFSLFCYSVLLLYRFIVDGHTYLGYLETFALTLFEYCSFWYISEDIKSVVFLSAFVFMSLAVIRVYCEFPRVFKSRRKTHSKVDFKD